ncbi:hypothetical protein Tco_0939975 [Tanacetum coccineum]|uniref:Uncharacterized protein n=1 Tax=Tanacetum coccineum TaxID=301880 RepID=A0ABQ5DLN9_9ASTR
MLNRIGIDEPSVMDVPLLLDHEFDFFAAEPVPGLAEAPNNQNSTYEVGGPSTATPVGHPLTTMTSGVATQPQVIDDLCDRMSNLEYRHVELVKKMVIASDAEVTDRITIGEIHPQVNTLEGQVQTLQTSLHGVWLQNQQLQTRLSDMEKRKGTWIAYMSWMEKHLEVLEKKLMGPPTGP